MPLRFPQDRKWFCSRTLRDHRFIPARLAPTASSHGDSLDADSIPWLLVTVVSHAGKGLLTDVTTIQRVHTHGGKPPADGCDESHKAAETKSSYTADYYFFAPAK